MFDSLVTEYLQLELPPLARREEGLAFLPAPGRHNLIHALVGTRHGGKTYHLFQHMEQLVERGVPRNRMLYVPFDDVRLGMPDAGTVGAVIDAYYALVPEADQGCYLFLDEIQEMPGWEAAVRRVVEQGSVTMVVAGSSTKALSTEASLRLRGRSTTAELWPLSFAEHCDVHGIETEVVAGTGSARNAGRLSQALRAYLEAGGFPAAQGLDPAARTKVLQGYVDDIVSRDVLARFGGATPRACRRFAFEALGATGTKFSVHSHVKALRDAGVTLANDAAYALLGEFEDAHLAFRVADYGHAGQDNPRSSYKLYACDPGLALASAPLGQAGLSQRLETAVFLELKRRYSAHRRRVVARYDLPGRRKVDFVVGNLLMGTVEELVQVAVRGTSGEAEMPLEPRATERVLAKRYRAELGCLRDAMAETRLRQATIVTLDDEADVRVGDGVVHIVPAWRWLLS